MCAHVCGHVSVRVLHRGSATAVSGSALRVKLMDEHFSQSDDALHPCREVRSPGRTWSLLFPLSNLPPLAPYQ